MGKPPSGWQAAPLLLAQHALQPVDHALCILALPGPEGATEHFSPTLTAFWSKSYRAKNLAACR